jgi:hypothetical protein
VSGDPGRAQQLIGVILATGSLAEMDGVRAQLADQGELTGEVYRAMQRRVDELARREGITAARWWRRRPTREDRR